MNGIQPLLLLIAVYLRMNRTAETFNAAAVGTWSDFRSVITKLKSVDKSSVT